MHSRTLFLAVVMVLAPGPALPVFVDDHLGEVQVAVEDATRTRPSLVESLVGRCLERGAYRSWARVDPASLAQCLKNSRLFSRVRVRIEAPKITVSITDRWTLIPIPHLYSSGGKRTLGAFVYESNLLGYGKKLGIGAAHATEGNSFSLFYGDDALGFSDLTLKGFALVSSADKEAYTGEDVIYGYQREEKSFSLLPGYRALPDLDIHLSLNYVDRDYERLGGFDPVPGDYHAWSLGAGFGYRPSDYKLFYNDGLSVRFRMFRQLSRSDDLDQVTHLNLHINWDQRVFREQVLQLGLQGTYQSDATLADVAMFGRRRGFRGIEPNGLWSNRILSVSTDYQVPIAHWGDGVLTVAPFVDYGYYQSPWDGEPDDFMAFGIGAYYFFNAVNLPGVGLALGRNDRFMGTYVSLQIGMGFGDR